MAELNLAVLQADLSASGDQAPRFRLLRTSVGARWRIRADIEPAVATELVAIAQAEPLVEAFESAPPDVDAYRAVLARSAPITREYRGPAFTFPDQLPDTPRAVAVTAEDHLVLEAHFDWAIEEWDDIQPVTGALEDGIAVSLCHAPASTALAAAAGVFTAEVARGHGYAVDVVALWARALRETDRLPLYGTTWDNAASRRLAEKLGLVMYGEDFHLL